MSTLPASSPAATEAAPSVTTATEPPSTPGTSFAVSDPAEYIDNYNLERYITAQDENNIYNRVITALRAGCRKPQPATWLWCVFPQMDGCKTAVPRRRDRLVRDKWPRGHAMVGGLDEARAVLKHPILGPRIRAAARALLNSPAPDSFTALDNMAYDVARVHSSITLFRQAARYPVCIHQRAVRVGENNVFREVLDRYFVKEPNSEDEDYEEEVDGHEEEIKKAGSRHGPTLVRLDELELEAAENRLAVGKACVCGMDRDKLFRQDIGSKFKIMDKQRMRLMKR